MRPLLRVTAKLALSALAGIAGAQAPTAHPASLLVTEEPRLVDCAPVFQSPCMSMAVTPVDLSGKPAPVTLPPATQLPGSIAMHGASGEITPFYASAGLGPDAAQHTSVVLLMIDISGSMKQPMAGFPSRFAAAKSAIAQFLDGMQEGSDRVAIVPFESHNVVSTIRSAVFTAHKSDALAQLNALPAPGPKNNTALYQAMFSGEQALGEEVAALNRAGATPAELQAHLIVMTDGKNEVAAGDDPLLLNGDLGLQQAAAEVQASHFDTIGIGFGDPSAIDAAALRRLSTRFFYAADASQLLDALHVTRSAVSHAIHMTWSLPDSSRLSLAGRDPSWTPSLVLGDGSIVNGTPIRLVTPAISAPVYDRRATPEELRALIATHPAASAGWSTVLIHGLIYLLAAGLLLLLWFWLPRLIWGERYLGREAQRPQRWSSERSGVTSASGVQIRTAGPLPPGFTPQVESANPLQRSAAQTTQIQTREEFSKTRLSFGKE